MGHHFLIILMSLKLIPHSKFSMIVPTLPFQIHSQVPFVNLGPKPNCILANTLVTVTFLLLYVCLLMMFLPQSFILFPHSQIPF